jgi:RimJ/RimL family protein N-acetyltransferase
MPTHTEQKPLGSPRIDCGSCVLRPWRSGDEASLARQANDRDIWRNLRDQFPHPYTAADAAWWVAFASERPTALAIEVESHAVGGVSLRLLDDVERVTAEIGYWLGKPFWNRGITTAAVRAITRYGFAQFSLTRIFAVPFAANVASHKVLVNAGYTREGLMRRSAIKEGNVTDQLLFAITDRDLRARVVTPAVLDDLAQRFAALTLPKSEWTHAAHLAVGLWHVSRYGRDDALAKLRSGIRRLNESHSVANTSTGGYHETVTRAYVELLAMFYRQHAALPPAAQAEKLLSGALATRSALLQFYSRERLESAEARLEWAEPDLAPLALDVVLAPRSG